MDELLSILVPALLVGQHKYTVPYDTVWDKNMCGGYLGEHASMIQ